MKAMVLAAGLGTRLRPLTETWPKPAMPFLGQPLLRYTFALLARAGITGVGFNTHHLPEVMRRTAEAEGERFGLRTETVHEPVIQGTGGGIRGLSSFLRTEKTFVVFNGDILFAVDLKPLLETHAQSGAAATMVLLPMPAGEKYAAVETTPEGEVRRIAGHGPGGEVLQPWHFTGVHLMTPAVFDFMTPGAPEDINRDVYPRLMAKGLKVRGVVAQHSYWSDLGTPSRYLATQRDCLTGRVPLGAFPGASPFDGTLPGAGDGVRQHPTAQVLSPARGPALFGPRSRVAAGAALGGELFVGEDAEVAAGASLDRACVLAGTRIAAGERVHEAIAFRQHRIPAR